MKHYILIILVLTFSFVGFGKTKKSTPKSAAKEIIILSESPLLAKVQKETMEVIVDKTYLRKNPDSSGKIIRLVQRGEKVILEKTQSKNGWFYVSIMDGKVKGWINENTIKL